MRAGRWGGGGGGEVSAKTTAAAIIAAAQARGARTLDEFDSKRVLAAYGMAVTAEARVATLDQAVRAAKRILYPVVLKACSAEIAHKTERGLVAIGIADKMALARAFARLSGRAGKRYRGAWLVQEMVAGPREVMIGMTRDPAFGPAVMFGLGGIFAEMFGDAAFRLAPLSARDARAMLGEIKGARLLDAVRGLPAVDRARLARAIMAVGRIAADHDGIAEIDVNPLIIRGRAPVAADALIVVGR